MTGRMRWVRHLVVLGAAALAVVSAGSCSQTARDRVPVAVLIPYSPDTADFFLSMQLAVDEVNAVGGAHGRSIELILYDTSWDPEVAYATFLRAVDDGAVAVIGGLTSAQAQREAAAAALRRVPLVGCCSTSDELTTIQPSGVDHFFYRVVPSDRLQSVVLAESAYQRPDLACRALALVHTDDSYGNPLAAAIATRFTALGGAVVANVAHPFFNQDWSTQLATISATSVDCIAINSNVDDSRSFRKAWNDAGLPAVKWLGSDAVLGVATTQQYADPHLSDGIYATFPWPFGRPSAEGLLARFKTRFGRDTSPLAAGSYDAAAVVALALAASDSWEGDAVRDALVRVTNPGGASVDVGALGDGALALGRGEDVDYLGIDGNLDFDACGDVDTSYSLINLQATATGPGYSVLATGLLPSGITSPCP